jgi:hypothetical protein
MELGSGLDFGLPRVVLRMRSEEAEKTLLKSSGEGVEEEEDGSLEMK